MNIIGDPFGQKERLTDRIRDILKRYSGQHCIFKVADFILSIKNFPIILYKI